MKNTVCARGILVLFLTSFGTVLTNGQELEKKKMPDVRAEATAKMLERYDANKNGKLDADELEKIARDRLLVHDLNKDGHLDAAELRAMREKSHKMPEQDELDRAMAREEALNADRNYKAAKESKKRADQPANGSK